MRIWRIEAPSMHDFSYVLLPILTEGSERTDAETETRVACVLAC